MTAPLYAHSGSLAPGLYLPAEGYRNGDQSRSNHHHDQAREPGRKPGMPAKKISTQKQRCDSKHIGDAQGYSGVVDYCKWNDDGKCGRDNENKNTERALPVAARQPWMWERRRHLG